MAARSMAFCPTQRRFILSRVLKNGCCSTSGTVRRETTTTSTEKRKKKQPTQRQNPCEKFADQLKEDFQKAKTYHEETKQQRPPNIKRVNIVSKKLCDDLIEYFGDTLDRHEGCDLIDMNPGTGLWSCALHKRLKPRSHIMLEPDADFYRPYLSSLLKQRNVKLLKYSGFVWKRLYDVFDKHLPAQRENRRKGGEGGDGGGDDDPPRRNDTLLMTANLALWPKRTYAGFQSISTLLLYQFLASIRKSTLLQEYGLVRMLLWINDEDKLIILPRNATRRRRVAFEVELSCEWLHEMCGAAPEPEKLYAGVRNEWLNRESSAAAVARMAARGLVIPKRRQTDMYRFMMARREPLPDGSFRPEVPLWGDTAAPYLLRPYVYEMERLRKAVFDKKSGLTQEQREHIRRRHLVLKHRCSFDNIQMERQAELMRQRRDALALAVPGGGDSLSRATLPPSWRRAQRFAKTPPETLWSASLPTCCAKHRFAAADAEWNANVSRVISKNFSDDLARLIENHHLMRQTPPVMLWDRRAMEPLLARDNEFLPGTPLALVDVQPKLAAAPLRRYGSHTDRAGEISDMLLHIWHATGTSEPISDCMKRLWFGFVNEATPERCPSFTDPALGGSPLSGHGQVSGRAINERQWLEILDAWMNWPFRPSYLELSCRFSELSGKTKSEGLVGGNLADPAVHN